MSQPEHSGSSASSTPTTPNDTSSAIIAKSPITPTPPKPNKSPSSKSPKNSARAGSNSTDVTSPSAKKRKTAEGDSTLGSGSSPGAWNAQKRLRLFEVYQELAAGSVKWDTVAEMVSTLFFVLLDVAGDDGDMQCVEADVIR